MHTYYVTLDSSPSWPNGSQTRTIRCCCSTTFISPPVRECVAGLSAFLSLGLALYVRACVWQPRACVYH